MTAVVLTVAGIVIAMAGFYALAIYCTRDTGTRAAPRRGRDSWDEPDPAPYTAAEIEAAKEFWMEHWGQPGEPGGPDDPRMAGWLPAPTWPPPVTHEEEWQAAYDEWHSGVIVANVYTPTPAAPPLDYDPAEPFGDWLRDSYVGGMLAIGAGGD